ncbi:MAG: DUF2125 domain-containing protein [Allorhizobium sp.]
MATSSRSPISRKFALLGFAILAAVLLYTAGWFYATSLMKDRLTLAFNQDNPAAAAVTCDDMDVRGFPFRLGVYCSRVDIDDNRNGLSATFGAFRSAAQVYAPGHIVWEMDGPAEIRSALGVAVQAEWQNLRSSLIAGLGGMDRTSLEAEGLKASITSTIDNRVVDIDATHSELHLRREGEDLEAAILFKDIQAVIRDSAIPLPRISASADVTLAGKGDFINLNDESGKGLYGASGELRRLVVDLGEGRILTLSGPFSFGDDGYLSGEMLVAVESIDAWSASLQTLVPQSAIQIKSGSNMLKALLGGKDTGSATISIRNGQMSLSFIPLGTIPPI